MGLLLDSGNNMIGSPNAGKLEIGRILHLKSEIPKSQIGRASLNEQQSNLSFRDFGFEMQDSSNLKISLSRAPGKRVTAHYCRGAEVDSLKVPFCRAMSANVG